MSRKVAVLISGRGSNLLSLIKNAEEYHVAGIFSDKPQAPGLAYGKQFQIETHSFDRSNYNSVEKQKIDLFNAVTESNPDLIALAGFMKILSDDFVKKHYGKIVNIHPSLLPKFPGLKPHQQALDAKETEHGCSVQFVDTGVDTGPVIAQASCVVEENDSEQELAGRVLALEHKLYPWVIKHLALNNISLHQRKILFHPCVIEEGKDLGFKVCI